MMPGRFPFGQSILRWEEGAARLYCAHDGEEASMRQGATRIVIVGGGFGGIYTALELDRRMRRRRDLDVTLISLTNSFLYYPLLPEVISGGVEPRHVLVPLRTLFRHVRVLEGEVRQIDLEAKTVRAVRDPEAMHEDLSYDHLVLAMGADANLARFPEIEPVAFPFKTVTDALDLHTQIIDACEAAVFTGDLDQRHALLTFVVVGGGATGIECLGEIEAYLRGILDHYPGLRRRDTRLVLVEREDGILAEVGPELGAYGLRQLVQRGIEVHLGVSVVHATPEAITLSDGTRIPARTLVWTVGTAPVPLVRRMGLPLTHQGYVQAEATLAVPGRPGVWALGDTARIPTPEGGYYPPTAQHAVREAKVLASNLLAALAGEPPQPYRYHTRGTFISLGERQGVALFGGRPVRGRLAWMAWRAVHLWLLPGRERKLRVLTDWLFSRRCGKDIVDLGTRRAPSALRLRPRITLLREQAAEQAGSLEGRSREP